MASGGTGTFENDDDDGIDTTTDDGDFINQGNK